MRKNAKDSYNLSLKPINDVQSMSIKKTLDFSFVIHSKFNLKHFVMANNDEKLMKIAQGDSIGDSW